MLTFSTLIHLRHLLRQPYVFLELTPPARNDKASVATQRLFSVLHGLDASRTPKERVLRRKVSFSLEVVSTKTEGIRFLLRVPESDAANIERTINSYMPEVRCKRGSDCLSEKRTAKVVEIHQTGHFAYPLHFQAEFKGYDPMAYLSGAMTKLKEGELMAMQIVVSPTKVAEARSIQRKLLHNDEQVYDLGRRRWTMVGGIFGLTNSVLFGLLDVIGEVASGGSSRMVSSDPHAMHRQQAAMRIKPARTLSSFEQRLGESVSDKLNQPLFQVQIRVLVDATDIVQRVKGVRDWLALFAVPGYQSLRARVDLPWLRRWRRFAFAHRVPANGAILSASEIGDLYHFPDNQAARVENVVKSLSKTLPAPISLKNDPKFDVVLGMNRHHGTDTEIGLTEAERERHVYVIGGTGNGKTTMLEYGIVQDIRNGKGVAVIDPHGDLSARLLHYIPEERMDDVIYFNPADLSHPLGLNLLELPSGLEGDELIDAKDFLTESIISIMRKVFSDDDTGGHRIEYILRNTVHTALTLKDATLFTVFDLLINPKYAKKVAKELKDPKLKQFWLNELGKAGDFQRVKMSAGVTAKIGRFQFSASAERILSQPKSTINFEEILDGKIFICNFAKGLIGEDTSELFGISTLAKLQLAAYRRVKQTQADRKPFFLYVDEFQNFATMSFVQMLSESRKYRVFLTMAEQTTSQQRDQHMVNTILANVGTVVCFRSGNPADERLVLPLFEPYVSHGEIANLPTYNFYMRLAAVNSQEPVSGETVLLHSLGSEIVARAVIERSRAQYGKKKVIKTAAETREVLAKLVEATGDVRPT
jgi:hypothetical protein